MTITKIATLAAAAAVLLAGCQTTPPAPTWASAGLQPIKGSKAFGEATFEQTGKKVRFSVFAQGLQPEQAHALAIHEAGDCSGDGMAAKGRFAAVGALPPLKADKGGRAKLEVELETVSVSSGANGLLERSVIIYADPAGAGGRLACGVIRPS